MENEVKIIFKGDSKQLSKAIQQLDNATKKLLKTQAKINDFNKKQEQIDNSRVNTFRRLNAQLKLKGSNLKAVGLSTSIYKKALEGNAWALERVKIATRKHIAELGQQRQSFKKARVTSNSYQQSIQRAVSQQQKLKKGMFDTTNSGRLLDNTFATLRSKILLFNFAMALGVRQLIQFSRQASQVESLSRAFTTLSGGTAKSEKALQKLRNATNNTVSDFNLLKQANNALVLGVAKNSDEMAELFDMAQRLGNAVGRTADESIESLITGIGRQSRQMLDNIAIVVQSNEAYKNYANELKKSVDSLTDVEKKQAFLNATLESARKKIAELPIEIENSQTAFENLDAVLANSAVQIGEVLSPLILYLASGYGNLAEFISNRVTPVFAEFVKDILPLGSREHRELIKQTGKNIKTINQLESAMTSFIDVMFSTSRTIREVSEEQKKYEQSIKSTTKLLSDDFVALKKQEQILLGVSEATAQATAEKEAMRIALNIPEGQDFIATIDTATESQIKFKEAIQAVKDNIENINNSFETYANLQKKRFENFEIEQRHIEEFQEKYPKIAEALNLITEAQKKKNDEDERQAQLAEKRLKERIPLEEVLLNRQIQLLERQAMAVAGMNVKTSNATDNTKKMTDTQKEQIDNINMLAGSISALSGGFDVLANSQSSATAKMSAFLRMAGGLLSVLGGATPAGAFGGVLSAFGGAIGHTGGYIKQDGSIQRFARGGMVQGQDNVPIMAQAGEFIIRRSVVEDIGVNKLAELNNGQTGVGSTININIDGNVIGNEEFVRGTLIPEIRRTIGRGLA